MPFPYMLSLPEQLPWQLKVFEPMATMLLPVTGWQVIRENPGQVILKGQT